MPYPAPPIRRRRRSAWVAGSRLAPAPAHAEIEIPLEADHRADDCLGVREILAHDPQLHGVVTGREPQVQPLLGEVDGPQADDADPVGVETVGRERVLYRTLNVWGRRVDVRLEQRNLERALDGVTAADGEDASFAHHGVGAGSLVLVLDFRLAND